MLLHSGAKADPVDDWPMAERNVVWQPAVQVRQTDRQIEVLAAAVGVEPRDLDVQVSPEDLAMKAPHDHTHVGNGSTFHRCEFSPGQLCRSIHFPERIDAAQVTASYRNGTSRVIAPVAKAEQRPTDVGWSGAA